MQQYRLRPFAAENRSRTIAVGLSVAAIALIWGNVLLGALRILFGACVLSFLLSPISALLEKKLRRPLAALIALYKAHPDRMQDDPAALDCLIRQSVPDILKSRHLWGMDLTEIPGFAEQVENWFARIQGRGVRACIKELGA